MVVPDQRVQEAGPEEGYEELLSIHQDAIPLGHDPLHLDLHVSAHNSPSWMFCQAAASKTKDWHSIEL